MVMMTKKPLFKSKKAVWAAKVRKAGRQLKCAQTGALRTLPRPVTGTILTYICVLKK